jgi:hypothetical protein
VLLVAPALRDKESLAFESQEFPRKVRRACQNATHPWA